MLIETESTGIEISTTFTHSLHNFSIFICYAEIKSEEEMKTAWSKLEKSMFINTKWRNTHEKTDDSNHNNHCRSVNL